MTQPSFSLVLVGAGRMGGALLDGWLEHGLNPSSITILDPYAPAGIEALAARKNIALNPPLKDIPPVDVVVLAIKPQTLQTAAPKVNPLIIQGTLLLSILAGKTIADLRNAMPNARAIVRAMPNLPACVQRGVTAAFASPETSAKSKATAQVLLDGVGTTEWLTREDWMDAVTAVSGSGPAYVFYLTECLTLAGIDAGLPSDLAERLARLTVAGSGELMHREDLPVAKLRQSVTSPGGTTAAALDILMADTGLPDLMRRAVAAAKHRSKELSG